MPNLNAVGIVVSDMAESIRFYRLLGLDVPDTPGEGHVDAFLPNGVRFMLVPWDAFWGQRYAQLQDPTGVPVDLYAPL